MVPSARGARTDMESCRLGKYSGEVNINEYIYSWEKSFRKVPNIRENMLPHEMKSRKRVHKAVPTV